MMYIDPLSPKSCNTFCLIYTLANHIIVHFIVSHIPRFALKTLQINMRKELTNVVVITTYLRSRLSSCFNSP